MIFYVYNINELLIKMYNILKTFFYTCCNYPSNVSADPGANQFKRILSFPKNLFWILKLKNKKINLK